MRRVELFELIRRDFFDQCLSKREIARKHHVHRRAVRQAIASAIPPARRSAVRARPVLTDEARAFVDGILLADRKAPRKQRHTRHGGYGSGSETSSAVPPPSPPSASTWPSAAESSASARRRSSPRTIRRATSEVDFYEAPGGPYTAKADRSDVTQVTHAPPCESGPDWDRIRSRGSRLRRCHGRVMSQHVPGLSIRPSGCRRGGI